jgi:hypothetical protein
MSHSGRRSSPNTSIPLAAHTISTPTNETAARMMRRIAKCTRCTRIQRGSSWRLTPSAIESAVPGSIDEDDSITITGTSG